MKTSTRQDILKYIQSERETTIGSIVKNFGISPQMVHRHINNLVSGGFIEKNGTAPQVFYTPVNEDTRLNNLKILYHEQKELFKPISDYINNHYIYILPSGRILKGTEGFMAWCENIKCPYVKTAQEYVITMKKYDKYKHNGIIDGTSKFVSSFDKSYLKKVFYGDFFAVERFGKTKLGKMVLYAKQSQSLFLMAEIYTLIKDELEKIIDKYHIDAIGFIPPTVPRKIQFQKVMSDKFNLPIKRIKLVKIINDLPIPQKTLTSISDRIKNANSTIFIGEEEKFKNILLFDDAIGSGATLNETAKKLLQKGTGKNIYGFAVTGSLKGFDVINEL